MASKESDAIKCLLEAIDKERERVMSIKTVSKTGARSVFTRASQDSIGPRTVPFSFFVV